MKRLTRVLCALAVLGALVVGSRAQATILFQGGELPDFNLGCAIQGNTGLYRTAFARMALYSCTTPAIAPQSTLWVHLQYAQWQYGTSDNNDNWIVLYGTDGNPAFAVRGAGGGNIKFSSSNSSGSYTDLLTCSPPVNIGTQQQYDLKIVYAVAGSATLYQNSNAICSFTGNTTDNSRTTLDQVYFGSAGSSADHGAISEVIISTTDTRYLALGRLLLNAGGNTTAWTNSSGTTPCSMLGQSSINDSNYVYTGASGTQEDCTVSPLIPAGVWSVVGLGINLRALVGGTGPQHLTLTEHEGGTYYNLLTGVAPNYSFNPLVGGFITTDPATSAAFTTSTLTTAGYNLGFQSAN